MSGDIAEERKRPVRPALVAGAIALASVLVYLGTIGGGYPLDDEIQVANNVYVRNLAGAFAIFGRSTWPGYVYRPLPTLTYALTYALVGADPWLYHLTSILLHAAAAVLVFFVLRRIFADRLAAIAALLFAVHPAHVEAVASIANRTELLVAVCGLAGILVVLPSAHRRVRGIAEVAARILLGAVLFLAALLAKESAVALLLLLPLVLVTRKEVALREVRAATLLREAWPGGLAFGLALAGYFLARSQVLTRMFAAGEIAPIDNWLVTLSPPGRMVHAFALLGRYVSILLVPHGLSADYSSASIGVTRDLLAPDSLLYLVLACAVLLIAVVGWLRASQTLLFVGGWFLLSFAVTSNLAFPIGVVFADRLAYLPSVAICASLAWLLVRVSSAPVRRAAVAGLALLFSVVTVAYGGVWHDNHTLFLYELKTSPESAWVHAGLGNELLRVGAFDAARMEYREALRIYPAHTHAAHGLALIELAEGNQAKGQVWLERALDFDPSFVPSLNALGYLRLADGQVDEAGRLFVRALNADEGSVDARVGILAATLRRGNLTQAAALRDELTALDASRPDVRRLSEELDEQLAAASSGGASSKGGPG